MMLYKKEIEAVPAKGRPQIDEKMLKSYKGWSNLMFAAVQKQHLAKSGDVLMVDIYQPKAGEPEYRFVTDGLNWISRENATKEWSERDITNDFCTISTTEDDAVFQQFLTEKGLMDEIRRWGRPQNTQALIGALIDFKRFDSKRRAEERKEARIEKTLKSLKLPGNIVGYCEENVLPESYLFAGKKQKDNTRMARCGHCGRHMTIKTANYGEVSKCPKCGKQVRIYKDWIKKPTDKSTIAVATKVNDRTTVCWYTVERTFSDEGKKQYFFDPDAVTVDYLEKGKSKRYFYCMVTGYYMGLHWTELNDNLSWRDGFVYTDNLKDIYGDIKHIDLESYLKGKKVQFDLLLWGLQTNPAVEYIIKSGFAPSFAAALYRTHVDASSDKKINIETALGILPGMKDVYINRDVTYYEHLALKRYGKYVHGEDIDRLRLTKINMSDFVGALSKRNCTADFRKMLNYLERQEKLHPDICKKYGMGHILQWYTDYLDMCVEFGVDLSHKSVRYPDELKDRHDALARQRQEILDAERRQRQERQDAERRRLAEEWRKQEAERIKIREQWFKNAIAALYPNLLENYSKDGFSVVLPQSEADFIREGSSLNHCVGGQNYRDNHANGTRMIFFVRRTEDISKPFFTMELDMTDCHIRQLYGFGDCNAPTDVRRFAESYSSALLRFRAKVAV